MHNVYAEYGLVPGLKTRKHRIFWIYTGYSGYSENIRIFWIF
jgi:hypothetical protein